MIKDITVKNLPRQTGKSNVLKLEILSAILRNKNILVILPNRNMLKDYITYFRRKFNLSSDFLNSFISPSFDRLRFHEDTEVFIDEPFLIDTREQENLIELMERTGYNINVTAIGTRVHPKTFSDFL